jgi:lactoylglutathione lyase
MEEVKIEHVALWTNDLERLKSFYECYFGAVANKKYVNQKTKFESYFLTFSALSVRLELMYKSGVYSNGDNDAHVGWAHVAFAVGSKEAVDTLTMTLKNDGFVVLRGPRTTGDGYYESCVLDPDGNEIEITI